MEEGKEPGGTHCAAGVVVLKEVVGTDPATVLRDQTDDDLDGEDDVARSLCIDNRYMHAMVG